MCGIAGIYAPHRISADDIARVDRMNRIQRHRGPDDEGIFSDAHCVLGHRRLAIIDLSRAGHQPFASDDGRYHLTYNGEIYNYIELRAELEGRGWTFRTKTDTEVLLKAYQQFGAACLPRLNGIFAFTIYDQEKQELFLARDHVGIKPLYYTEMNEKIYFASEIKALRAIPGFSPGINQQAVFDFMVFNRTDIFDETFLQGVKRLPRGHYGILSGRGLKLRPWWDAGAYAEDTGGDGQEAALKKIEELLVSAVALQMRSDVPVGSCLSGGLDSSILTGILFNHDHAVDHFSTFTSSFPGHPIDETRYVDGLNKKFPFENHRTCPTDRTAYDHFHQFVYAVDEPTADSSFYSQYEVMRLARAHGVTVLLDGQGGDENFAGYQYFHGFYLFGLLNKRRYGRFAYELLKVAVRRQDRAAYQTLLFQILPDPMKKRALLKSLPFLSKDFFYAYIDSSRIYNEFFDAPDLHTSLVRHFQYKLEHLLRMEDRNSMAFSLEARVPYLDPRLIAYGLSVRDDLKIQGGTTKWLQKKALGRYTVPEILDRKDKIGFGTPMDEWMATPMWMQRTRDNFEYVKREFNGMMAGGLPAAGNQRWKINQLAEWHRMVREGVEHRLPPVRRSVIVGDGNG